MHQRKATVVERASLTNWGISNSSPQQKKRLWKNTSVSSTAARIAGLLNYKFPKTANYYIPDNKFEDAIKEPKNHKAPGVDEIPIELSKEAPKKVVEDLRVKIAETMEIGEFLRLG